MALTSVMYGACPAHLAAKKIDWVADDIRLALVTNAYTPGQDTHDFWDDVVANEATGTGWAANGVALTTKALAYDGATNREKLTADNISVAGVTVTWRYAVLYDRTPASDATRPLIGYIDFATDQSLVADTFALDWSTLGAVSFVVV